MFHLDFKEQQQLARSLACSSSLPKSLSLLILMLLLRKKVFFANAATAVSAVLKQTHTAQTLAG